MGYIAEHLPIIIAQNFEFFTFSAFAIAVFGFTDSKVKLSDAFLLLGLILMTISEQRNIYLLIPFGGIVIVQMINDFIEKNLGNSQDRVKTDKIFFILVMIVVFFISVRNFGLQLNDNYLEESIFPVSATEWVKNNLDLENIKLYNDYNFGSYLLLNDVPVFIDSRSDLYTPEFNKGVYVFEDYMMATRGIITYKNLFDKYGITHAMVYKGSMEDIYLSEYQNTKLLYEDEYFVIYEYQREG